MALPHISFLLLEVHDDHYLPLPPSAPPVPDPDPDPELDPPKEGDTTVAAAAAAAAFCELEDNLVALEVEVGIGRDGSISSIWSKWYLLPTIRCKK